MTAGRIALITVLAWSALCFIIAGITFLHLDEIESPERYIAHGLAMRRSRFRRSIKCAVARRIATTVSASSSRC
ncbi:MAG: hypothetical protein ACTHQM_14780 [Thermoanaerobaculia bacterium]